MEEYKLVSYMTFERPLTRGMMVTHSDFRSILFPEQTTYIIGVYNRCDTIVRIPLKI